MTTLAKVVSSLAVAFTLLAGGFLALALLAGCAATTADDARRAQITEAAQGCQRQYPEVIRFEVDRFGQISYWYRQNAQAQEREAFLACVRAKLGSPPQPSRIPTVTPGTVRP